MKLLAVGADPEVFLKKGRSPFSAEGVIGGTKHKPLQMDSLPAGFFVQEDNVAAEFNIPPCSTKRDFSDAIARSLSYLKKKTRKKGLTLEIAAAMDFPMDQLMTMQAQTLGCEPDFNAWTGLMNEAPEPPISLRTAAGHVHISFDGVTKEKQQLVVKACDVGLGIPSLFVTKPNPRRSLYGKAGAFRYKSYGVEYRTLDNFWIANKNFSEHVFDGVRWVIDKINADGVLFEDMLEGWGEEIQECINTFDYDLALKLSNLFGSPSFPMQTK